MWIKDSSIFNLVRVCTGTSGFLVRDEELILSLVYIWLLISSSPVPAHWMPICGWSVLGAALEPAFCLRCISRESGSRVLRLFCSVIQSRVSADDRDNLLCELLPIWTTAPMSSHPLYVVLITSGLLYSPELQLKKWVINWNSKFW